MAYGALLLGVAVVAGGSTPAPHELHCESITAALPTDMEDIIPARSELGTLAHFDRAALPRSTDEGREDTVRRWRLTLERRWERKLGQVIALTAASDGMSAAGDDVPAAMATPPSRWLEDRAAAAYEELGAIADALARMDSGTYGACEHCKRQFSDDALARDPLRKYCAPCALRQEVRSS